MMNKEMPTKFLKCPVCLELPVDAVECTNCTNIFCEKCAADLVKKDCPVCRKKLVVKISMLA